MYDENLIIDKHVFIAEVYKLFETYISKENEYPINYNAGSLLPSVKDMIKEYENQEKEF